MAHQVLVDAHVQVDARISVSEGHRIAESARQRVLRGHPEVLDVLVHIDPEDDMDPICSQPACRRGRPAGRTAALARRLAAAGKVDLALSEWTGRGRDFSGHDFFDNGEALKQAEATLADRLKAHANVRSVSLNCLVAPN
jgi:hypothetical protein